MTINTDEILEDILSTTPQTGLVARPENRGRGKGALHLDAQVVRELEEEDLVAASSHKTNSEPTPLQSIRMSHHRVAQLMAQGYKNVDISRKTGYSQSRLSILKNDPAFQDLVASYKDVVDSVFADTAELLQHCTDDTLALLQERLLDDPDSFTNAQLNELLKTFADRSGFGPQNKTVNEHNVNFLAPEKIQELKAKAKELQHGETKKITQEKLLSDNREPTRSTPDEEASVIEVEETEGG